MRVMSSLLIGAENGGGRIQANFEWVLTAVKTQADEAAGNVI